MNKENKRGFTLIELLMAVSILTLVLAAAFSSYILHKRVWQTTSMIINTSQEASSALSHIAYGIDRTPGLREAYASSVIPNPRPNGNWIITFDTPSNTNCRIRYQANNDRIQARRFRWGTLAENVVDSTITPTNGGIEIMVSIAEQRGREGITNTMTTFIEFRNEDPL